MLEVGGGEKTEKCCPHKCERKGDLNSVMTGSISLTYSCIFLVILFSLMSPSHIVYLTCRHPGGRRWEGESETVKTEK